MTQSAMGRPRVRRGILLLLCCSPLCGCFGIGAERLSRDEIDFSRALAISDNQQTLLNIVRLRYGEAPTFLQLTQVISGYQAQQTVSGSFELFPASHPSTYLGGGGAVQLQESPTFTYAPVTGDRFTDTFLRPLPPGDVLPLLLSGAPIDLLLAMIAQSIDRLDNAQVLAGSDGIASPRFERLVHDLRALQVAGLLDIQLGAAPPAGAAHVGGKTETHERPAPAEPMIAIRDSDDPALGQVATDARQLLGMRQDATPFSIGYGDSPTRSRELSIQTRTMLGILSATALSIEIPPADVASGRTMPTIAGASPVTVHSGPSVPADAFVAVHYYKNWFWISGRDFRSKLCFAILQTILSLAQTKTPPSALVTIPAG